MIINHFAATSFANFPAISASETHWCTSKKLIHQKNNCCSSRAHSPTGKQTWSGMHLFKAVLFQLILQSRFVHQAVDTLAEGDEPVAAAGVTKNRDLPTRPLRAQNLRGVDLVRVKCGSSRSRKFSDSYTCRQGYHLAVWRFHTFSSLQFAAP